MQASPRRPDSATLCGQVKIILRLRWWKPVPSTAPMRWGLGPSNVFGLFRYACDFVHARGSVHVCLDEMTKIAGCAVEAGAPQDFRRKQQRLTGAGNSNADATSSTQSCSHPSSLKRADAGRRRVARSHCVDLHESEWLVVKTPFSRGKSSLVSWGGRRIIGPP